MAIVYIGRKLVHNGDKVGGEKILYLKLILLFLNYHDRITPTLETLHWLHYRVQYKVLLYDGKSDFYPMLYNLSSVSKNVLIFYQQLTGEERRIPFIFDDFHFCRSRVIGLDMTENRIFTLCRMIT